MDLSSSYRLLWMCSNYQPALGYQKVKHWLILRQSRATALEIISLVKQFGFFFFPSHLLLSCGFSVLFMKLQHPERGRRRNGAFFGVS